MKHPNTTRAPCRQSSRPCIIINPSAAILKTAIVVANGPVSNCATQFMDAATADWSATEKPAVEAKTISLLLSNMNLWA